MKYKLIVSDFDETLRGTESGIPERNAQAIRDYTAAGGIFAICTGRMMSSILPYAQNLKLDSLLVGYQGAIVTDLRSGSILRNIRHSTADAARICRVMEEMNLHIHVYDNDKFYVNMRDDLLLGYQSVCKVQGVLVSNGLAEYVIEHKIQPQKILAMVEMKDKAFVYGRLSELLGKDFYVTTSAGALVEITPKGCDKGDAVRFLSDYYKIPLSEIIAIGDNVNDVPMIVAAGLGVAVGNAVEELKAVANLVTVKNTENAVAKIIEEYGLERRV